MRLSSMHNPHSDGPDIDALTATMVDRLMSKFSSLKIVLFGSRTREDAEASSDIDVAQLLAKDSVAYRSICHHSQQAAGKALKAGLVIDRKSPPRTHNLETLRRLMVRDRKSLLNWA